MNQKKYIRSAERGATLFVSLILLVLISLIGAAALKNASVEEQMASNLLQKNVTFQASESAVEETINDPNLLSDALAANGQPVERVVTTSNSQVTAKVTYTYVGDGPAGGYSIGNGGGFSAAQLMVTAVGEVPDTDARTTTVHGIYRVSPSAD